MARQIAGHRVDAVRQVLPGAGDARHLCLATELAFGTNFAGNTRHFRRERVELIHHRIECVFQLENFAAHVDRNLVRQVAACHRSGHFGDVADLTGKVRGHRIDAIGQVFPGAGNATNQRLAAELAFGADLAGDTRHFSGKGVELVHHRVDGIFQFENFTAHVDRDLL